MCQTSLRALIEMQKQQNNKPECGNNWRILSDLCVPSPAMVCNVTRNALEKPQATQQAQLYRICMLLIEMSSEVEPHSENNSSDVQKGSKGAIHDRGTASGRV